MMAIRALREEIGHGLLIAGCASPAMLGEVVVAAT